MCTLKFMLFQHISAGGM